MSIAFWKWAQITEYEHSFLKMSTDYWIWAYLIEYEHKLLIMSIAYWTRAQITEYEHSLLNVSIVYWLLFLLGKEMNYTKQWSVIFIAEMWNLPKNTDNISGWMTIMKFLHTKA